MVSSTNTRPSLRRLRQSEDGYVLLTMLLAVSLIIIFAAAALPTIIFTIRRDREQEMIHRGVQYSRAIRLYYKKFGRYPTRLEDLDNTNNLRYLRKHYKDPLNKNKEFKLLHFGDPDLKLSGTIGGGTIPGATPVGATSGLNASGSSGSAFGRSSFGGSNFGNSGVNSSGVFAQPSSGLGGNSNSGLGANSNSQNSSNQTTANSTTGTNSTSGTDSSQPSTQSGSGTAQSSSSGGQQPIASGPIVGVASLNKDKTIREFNKKTKYNEWQFIYDPTADRGGIITTPYQPALAFTNQPALNGQSGSTTGTSSTSPFGQSSFGQSSFGQSSSGQSGYGNNSNSGGTTTPQQPTTTSPPQ
jgi:type II secretory pathway pseudopilin PulG